MLGLGMYLLMKLFMKLNIWDNMQAGAKAIRRLVGNREPTRCQVMSLLLRDRYGRATITTLCKKVSRTSYTRKTLSIAMECLDCLRQQLHRGAYM